MCVAIQQPNDPNLREGILPEAIQERSEWPNHHLCCRRCPRWNVGRGDPYITICGLVAQVFFSSLLGWLFIGNYNLWPVSTKSQIIMQAQGETLVTRVHLANEASVNPATPKCNTLPPPNYMATVPPPKYMLCCISVISFFVWQKRMNTFKDIITLPFKDLYISYV